MRRWSLSHFAAPVFALVFSAGIALAQTGGIRLFGSVDFEMDAIRENDSKPVRLRYLAARQILRIEMLDGSGQALLLNLPRGDLIILVGGGQRVFGRRSSSPPNFQIVPGDRIRELAGERCREATLNGSAGCIADDGIPLMVRVTDGDLVAQRVLRQPQIEALFTLPKDTKIQPMPGYSGPLPAVPF